MIIMSDNLTIPSSGCEKHASTKRNITKQSIKIRFYEKETALTIRPPRQHDDGMGRRLRHGPRPVDQRWLHRDIKRGCVNRQRYWCDG